jgi:hypothetical protein
MVFEKVYRLPKFQIRDVKIRMAVVMRQIVGCVDEVARRVVCIVDSFAGQRRGELVRA